MATFGNDACGNVGIYVVPVVVRVDFNEGAEQRENGQDQEHHAPDTFPLSHFFLPLHADE